MKNTHAVAEAPVEKRKSIDKMYTVSDVAVFFSLKENTIYRWIRLKKIEVIRIGNNVRIPHAEVMRIVTEKQEMLKD